MALAQERKLQVGLMIPIISSGKRREYVPVGSTAASMPPTCSPEMTEISLRRMALTYERKLQVGLVIPIISCEKRREYVPVGSTAASMPPSFSPETTGISLSQCFSWRLRPVAAYRRDPVNLSLEARLPHRSSSRIEYAGALSDIRWLVKSNCHLG